MFFNFTFRQYLTNPHRLADDLQTSTIRGFRKRIVFVFLAGLLLFGARSWWGMGTEALTPLVATTTTADFTLARFASFIGSLAWSIIYISFHFFGFAYIIHLLIKIPYKKLLPLQLLVTSLLLVEKALIFLVFATKGGAANYSFLSFGPLAATYLESKYMILFLNQLTLTTAVIIALQYSFIRAFTDESKRKSLLWTLIGIHLVLALLTASVGFIPIETLFDLIFDGGGVQ
ncbi:hypothetical protein JSQ81_15445 [Sporosarcina sp. Marseille-Q4063]|uniref:hypothetical protein n=1 Tax=Sporosarcina sp. Marseille-Q4063 TaxID=2810514 RepID=UPI001BB08D9F|nr:hypothetical protein [Sporosarcina sp. Marseille-Q4063]QUW21190.1 hypothetical protein JSQ81_15445 [Sporosarcina sp. Marseille-Q4063]